MLRGNWMQASISTVTPGSPDTLTLADVSGFPNIDDFYGTSGTSPELLFIINQYTDATRQTLSQAQIVYGTVALSTKVLTQTKIVATWSGSTYDDTSPTELTFTAGANTTRVFIGPTSDSNPMIIKNVYDGWFGHPDGTELWYPSNVVEGVPGSKGMIADTLYLVPFLWLHAPDREIARAAIDVFTLASGKSVRAALYNLDKGNSGLPGDLVADFGTFSTTTTGEKVNTSGSWTSPTANFRLAPGWYWAALVSDGTPVLGGPTQFIPGPIPLSGGRPGRWFTRTMTFGTFASKGYNNGSGSWGGPINNDNVPMLYLGM